MLIPVGRGPDQSVHDVTIVDMGKVPEPHVSMLQLAELIHIWPPAVISHMTWRQREMERMRNVVKDNSRKPCTFCGVSIKINMYRHVVRCHLQLAQLWRCPVPWCTIWKGTSQDLMTHIVLGHKVPEEAKRADVQKFFPLWTVTREQYAESLSPKHSGISNDVLLFTEVQLTLVHHYRVHSAGQPHAMFRGKYLAQLQLLHLTGSTTPVPENPVSNVGPQVTHVSDRIDDSCARLRPPSETSLGNAGPQVTHVSGRIDDLCARLRPPSETSHGNAGPQVTHVFGRIDDSCAGLRPPSEEKSTKFRLQPPETTVFQSEDNANKLRECASGPDVSPEGPFDVHRVMHRPDTPLRSRQDGQGWPFRITSYDMKIEDSGFSPEYGVQLHDPRFLEYVGAPESARLLSRDPEYWVEHMWREKTISAALQLQHDAGLILNVQILQQLVTALHGVSANVMGAVRGHQPFPTQAMQHALVELSEQHIT